MRYRLIFFILLLIPQLLTITASAQTADLILTNGKIFTSDTTRLYVQALAIKGNRVLAVGNNRAIEKLATSKTKRIDLEGKTVTPGFNDAHDHPAWLAPIGKFLNKNAELNNTGLNKKSILDSVAMLVKDAKPGEWIHGFIGTDVFFDTSMRESLDSLAPNNPVELQIWWGHGIVVNQKALEMCGIADHDEDPLGGWYVRNGSNKISSLQQNAQAVVWIKLNESEPHNLVKGLQSYVQEQLVTGITSVQYMGTGFTAKAAGQIFHKVNSPQRIRMIPWQRSTANGRQSQDWNIADTDRTPMFTISGVKYVIDGSPGDGNSLSKKSYTGRGNGNGRLNYPIDTMKQIMKEALTSNRQLVMHITGDSSFSIVLSLMMQSGSAEQWNGKRVRIEHNFVKGISLPQMKILKDYGILMMHTSKYSTGSQLKSLMDNGVMVGMSPDGTTNPFFDIMMCTAMQQDSTENINRETAVMAYTRTNAYAEFKEKEKGTLMPGMLADLAVLSQDIFAIPLQQLPGIKSVLTIIDGKIAYQQHVKSVRDH
ncbi:MAG: amidohydrolase family protein [Chryseolinea sp.]